MTLVNNFLFLLSNSAAIIHQAKKYSVGGEKVVPVNKTLGLRN